MKGAQYVKLVVETVKGLLVEYGKKLKGENHLHSNLFPSGYIPDIYKNK